MASLIKSLDGIKYILFEKLSIIGQHLNNCGGHFEIQNGGPRYQLKNWQPFFCESVKFIDAI